MTGFQAATTHCQFKLFGEIEEFENYSESSSAYIDADVVVMDEVSMTDMGIFSQVLSRLSPATKLVLVGDPNQLPSVQPRNVLHELLKLSIVPSMQLTKVFRQADGTCIAESA